MVIHEWFLEILFIKEMKITFRIAHARMNNWYRLYLKVCLLNIIGCFTDQISFLQNRRTPQRYIGKRLKLSCWRFCVWPIYLFLARDILRGLNFYVNKWWVQAFFHFFYFVLSEIVFFYTLNFGLDGNLFTPFDLGGGIN